MPVHATCQSNRILSMVIHIPARLNPFIRPPFYVEQSAIYMVGFYEKFSNH
jgi:hypothetical protein